VTVGDGPQLSIERLMAQLVEQAGQILSAQHRLQRLLDANRTIVSELSLPAVLRQIVESARETAGAQYAGSPQRMSSALCCLSSTAPNSRS